MQFKEYGLVTRFRVADHTQLPASHRVIELVLVDLGPLLLTWFNFNPIMDK